MTKRKATVEDFLHIAKKTTTVEIEEVGEVTIGRLPSALAFDPRRQSDTLDQTLIWDTLRAGVVDPDLSEVDNETLGSFPINAVGELFDAINEFNGITPDAEAATEATFRGQP